MKNLDNMTADIANFTTLCYIIRRAEAGGTDQTDGSEGDCYLMMHRVKKEGDMNREKWLGVGGHFEEGESPEECVVREVQEETGLTLTSYRYRGLITFVSDQWPTEYISLYTADGYEGTLTDCDEGTLEWVRKDRIDELNLWEGDRIFFALLEEEGPFFSLKLEYQGEILKSAAKDGVPIELIDERDSRGEVTGRVGARFVMHRNGMMHGTAHVWVLRPNEKSGFDLLLQKRSRDKDAFPGCYDISSAGHIPAGGDYLESALRELEEELGIEAEPEDLADLGFHEEMDVAEFYGQPFRNHEISRIFVYRKPVDEASLNLQKEEVESVMWMDYEECLQKMKDGSLVNCLNETELPMIAAWWKRHM